MPIVQYGMCLCLEKCFIHERVKRKGEGKEFFEACNARQIARWDILLVVCNPGIPYAVNDSHISAYTWPLRGEDLIDVSDPVSRCGDVVLAHKVLDFASNILGPFLFGKSVDATHRAQRISALLFKHLRESQSYGDKALF